MWFKTRHDVLLVHILQGHVVNINANGIMLSRMVGPDKNIHLGFPFVQSAWNKVTVRWTIAPEY